VAIAKREDDPTERILLQCLLAQLSQTVDPIAEIDRLNRDQDFHLRGNLQHQSALQKLRLKATTSGAAPFQQIRIFSPFDFSNSMTHSPDGLNVEAGNSTNVDESGDADAGTAGNDWSVRRRFKE